MGWTRRSLKVPSNPNYSMFLSFRDTVVTAVVFPVFHASSSVFLILHISAEVMAFNMCSSSKRHLDNALNNML